MKSDLAQPLRTTFTQEGIRKINFNPGSKLIKKLSQNWQEFVSKVGEYPDNFEGRGIVICAGQLKYFTCAWINIELLRMHGCTLPIEVWYTGNELTFEVMDALKDLNVVCKDVMNYTNGSFESYAIKPFSILHSDFKEVLYLDADNNCVKNPEYLFESKEYLQFGALFWPDLWTTDKKNAIWKIIGSKEYKSIEQESGQILINKEKCWKELNLCLYFNIHRQYYYRLILGDKDTFKFAWLALDTAYYMNPTSAGLCGFRDKQNESFWGMSLVQHDTSGNILFIHRNGYKWDITLNTERLWQEIKRFKINCSEKRIISRRFGYPGGTGITFTDLEGDLESFLFEELFGDFELKCLELLKKLRQTGFYANFMLHTYFLHFKPGYLFESEEASCQ